MKDLQPDNSVLTVTKPVEHGGTRFITKTVKDRLTDIANRLGGELTYQDWKDSSGKSGMIIRIRVTDE